MRYRRYPNFYLSSFAALVWVLFTTPSPAQRVVQYSLNPTQAESVLAGLSERPRLLDGKWREIVGGRASQPYAVKPGDNLWRISSRLFGNPFYWAKLWEMNPDLTNPHELTKGGTLAFYNENVARGLASEGQQIIRIPVTKLLPEKKGSSVDLDNDGVVNVDIKNRFHPRFAVLTENDKIYGTISGAYTDTEWIGLTQEVYIKSESAELAVGKTYSVIHEEKDLMEYSNGDSPTVGNIVQVVGEVKILEIGEQLVKGEVTGLFGALKRGDKIIEAEPTVNWEMKFDPPKGMQCRVMMGEDPDLVLFGQGQLILLDKGTVDGMKVGYVFRVWQDEDLFTTQMADVEPGFKGEVQVIRTSMLSSVGYILRNNFPLKVGDTLVPRQTFANPSRIRLNRLSQGLIIE